MKDFTFRVLKKERKEERNNRDNAKPVDILRTVLAPAFPLEKNGSAELD